MYNTPMKTRVTKWGNSLAIRLPKLFAVQMGIDPGSEVEVRAQDDTIVITKAVPSLEDLLRGVHPANIHSETETGTPIGREVW